MKIISSRAVTIETHVLAKEDVLKHFYTKSSFICNPCRRLCVIFVLNSHWDQVEILLVFCFNQ